MTGAAGNRRTFYGRLWNESPDLLWGDSPGLEVCEGGVRREGRGGEGTGGEGREGSTMIRWLPLVMRWETFSTLAL